MRWLSAVCCLAVGGAAGFAAGVKLAGADDAGPTAPWGEGPPEVSNAFWDEVAVGDGGSTVRPESSCKEIGEQAFRCYARWAPVGQPSVFTYEGTVNVYPDGRIVVSDLSRTPEAKNTD